MAGEGQNVQPKDPATVPCEWCGEPSTEAIPRKGKRAQHIYVCDGHVGTAERANKNKAPQRKLP